MPGVPIIVGPASSTTGTSLTTLRHRLAEQLGYFATGTVTTQAASLEAERYVISDQIQSDEDVPGSLNGLYLWVRSGTYARTQRKLVSGSFDGSYGAVAVDRAYTGALAVGTAFEISVLPAEKYQGAEGLNHILNLALEALPVIDYVSVTLVAGQNQYSLGGYAWPIRDVAAVVYPRASATAEERREAPRGSWTFYPNADEPTLSFTSMPGVGGDVIEVKLLRPANTWIKSGSSWGSSTTGLSAEDDACLYDANTVVAQALPIAKQRLASLYPQGSKERALLLKEAQGDAWAAALAKHFARFRGNGAVTVGARGHSGTRPR